MSKNEKINNSTKDCVSFFPTEIKTNDVLFDEARHKHLLNSGSMSYSSHQGVLIITRLSSGKRGFGTASMREFVSISLSEYNGEVRKEASWSSIIFHLKMGMIPERELTPYVENVHGTWGLSRINRITSLLSEAELSKDYKLLEEFKSIYRLEYKLGAEKEVSAQDIFESISYFKALLDKQIDYLQYEFIPRFLDLLSHNIGSDRPQTSSSGSIVMRLSSLGKARWQDTIKRKIEFQPFRDFAHLHPYMTSDQRKKLAEILIQHEAALKKASDETTCQM